MYNRSFLLKRTIIMKRNFKFLEILFATLCMAEITNAADNLDKTISFPGAEGFGKYTTGGRAIDNRGSNVFYVTSLSDDGTEGTLRWALTTGDDTPRTILFNTCGTIYLKSVLRFSHPNVSIEGQAAPGGGICIAGSKLYVNKNNVIIRYIRFRAGDLESSSYPAIDVENTSHVIIDHCSFTWSMEECMTMYDNDSTTVQWCIVGEGLYNSKNIKGARAYAAQWGGEHSTYHHNLITNCNNRTPRMNGVRDDGTTVGAHDQFVDEEFINNVVFNWGKPNSCYGGENYAPNINGHYNRIYMINNYYKPGPWTCNNIKSTRYFANASRISGIAATTGQWYLSGNTFEYNSAASGSAWESSALNSVNTDNLFGVSTGSSLRAFNIDEGNSATNVTNYTLTSQILASDVNTQPAIEAYKKVVSIDGSGAGAQKPRLDEVDTRLLQEASGTIAPQYYGSITNNSKMLGIIDSQTDIKLSKNDPNITGWPYLGLNDGETTIVDSDGDGMPDTYEKEKGFNKNDATDGATIANNGYSNLENYLNAIADGSYVYSGVKNIKTDTSTIKGTEYYDTIGIKHSTPKKGINIEKKTMSNGSIISTKITVG
jgi:hypothetical protein